MLSGKTIALHILLKKTGLNQDYAFYIQVMIWFLTVAAFDREKFIILFAVVASANLIYLVFLQVSNMLSKMNLALSLSMCFVISTVAMPATFQSFSFGGQQAVQNQRKHRLRDHQQLSR